MTSPTEQARADDLRRMRRIATGLLGVMALIFVAASLGARRWPGLLYLRAFAEAGMVGACADWFAVTALFRRPFGLPIPHTGIIPRSKDRIGDALGSFIADNFLTEEVLDAKLRQLELARWGGHWLRQPGNAARLASRITRALPELLALSPPEARRDLFATVATGLLRATPAAPVASTVLQALWSDGRAQPMLDRGLDLIAAYLADHEDLIRSQLQGRAARWLPKWVDRKIGDKIVRALADIVEEMRSPDHPWRVELQAAIADFIQRLAHDPKLRAKGEALKLSLLDDPQAVAAYLAPIAAELEARLSVVGGAESAAITEALTRTIASLGEWLDTDEATRATLNAWARAAASRLIAPQRHEIGLFIAQVVAGWDTRSIVEKLELQVGKDLQYIRVNGTLVGGLVGLLIFAMSQALGLS